MIVILRNIWNIPQYSTAILAHAQVIIMSGDIKGLIKVFYLLFYFAEYLSYSSLHDFRSKECNGNWISI